MSILRDEFESAQTGGAYFELGTAQAYRVTGSDAARYLHSRLTNDIKQLRIGQGLPALMLSPQGKIEAALIVLRTEDSFTICALPPLAPDFEEGLLRFKVADDVSLTALGDFKIFAAPNVAEMPGIRSAPFTAISGLFIAAEESQEAETVLSLESSVKMLYSAEVFDAIRALQGAVCYGTDFSFGTPVYFLDLEGFVSFSKGCYAGQEVVETVASRGRAGKKFISFSGESDGEPDTRDVRLGSETIATATTLVYLPWEKRFYGIALLRSEDLQREPTLGEASIDIRAARL